MSPPAQPRTDREDGPGPLRVRGHVVANEPAGSYRVLTVTAPRVPARFLPGQFVAIAVGGQQSPMLGRRAFSIYEAGRQHVPWATEPADTVRVVFAVHGSGTAWLAGLDRGESLDLLGPLGHPFTLPAGGARCVLVGGGYGSAPLFALAELALRRGCPVDVVLGAATADRVFGARRARRLAASAVVTTADGSLGERGVVTDVLPPLLRDRPTPVVYACGPMPMLREVTAVAAPLGVPTQVAVEESMACGIGVCMTCVLPVTGDDGLTRMTRSCVEGPVFSGMAVRWDDVGTVPGDAVGAR